MQIAGVEERRRPLGIWVIVMLQSLNALLILADVFAGTNLSGNDMQRLTQGDEAARALAVTWALLVLVAAHWLWTLSRRGWVMMMLLVGTGLIFYLVLWWVRPADAQWLSMGIAVVTTFYLNSAAVRRRYVQHHEVPRISLGGRSAQ